MDPAPSSPPPVSSVEPAYRVFIDTLNYLPLDEVALVCAAYRFSDEAHHGQTRLSGEPYITHPLAVAGALAVLVIGAGMIRSRVGPAIAQVYWERYLLSVKAAPESSGPGATAVAEAATGEPTVDAAALRADLLPRVRELAFTGFLRRATGTPEAAPVG